MCITYRSKTYRSNYTYIKQNVPNIQIPQLYSSVMQRNINVKKNFYSEDKIFLIREIIKAVMISFCVSNKKNIYI